MSELEDKLKKFCDDHWLKKASVNEKKCQLKILLRHKTHSVPFSLDIFGVVKEVRYKGLVFPIKESSLVRFLSNTLSGIEIALNICKPITTKNGQDMIFVTVDNYEFIFQKEPMKMSNDD